MALKSVQIDAIQAFLSENNKNYVLSMASQGGKSFCYQVPGAHFFKKKIFS